ncbi:hypothetical protein O181_061166 [Austropuccinia psidii MF-1]|uniref:Uncharacterized protein n=1 Tax=Austropuccinia psidii MF-1 TaxID=1389203 RepID=A0A9Q3EM92_9BASI|nr:hypothetical protein [Austropuccinia psidii MF-1]
MAEIIFYTKTPVKEAFTNFKAPLARARIIDEPFLAGDLPQKLKHLSPRSNQVLVSVVEFFPKVSYTTDPTSLNPEDHPERSKVTPNSCGLRYVFNQLIGTITDILYLHVQSRNTNNVIPLPGEAKRAANRNISIFFCFIKPPCFRTSISFHLSSKQPILSNLERIYGTIIWKNRHSRQAQGTFYNPFMKPNLKQQGIFHLNSNFNGIWN